MQRKALWPFVKTANIYSKPPGASDDKLEDYAISLLGGVDTFPFAYITLQMSSRCILNQGRRKQSVVPVMLGQLRHRQKCRVFPSPLGKCLSTHRKGSSWQVPHFAHFESNTLLSNESKLARPGPWARLGFWFQHFEETASMDGAQSSSSASFSWCHHVQTMYLHFSVFRWLRA